MILICGIPTEAPVERVCTALDELAIPFLFFNQRRFAEMGCCFEITHEGVTGILQIDKMEYPLEEIHGVYTRLMDDQILPELRELPVSHPLRIHCRSLHETIIRWLEITPARVVNRTCPMGSNSSKPYQMQLIQQYGFAVPETLVTNNPELVKEFHKQHDRVIYKSISSVRSIVHRLKVEDYPRLDRIRWCPTLFQVFIEGINVRVHVVDQQVFATRIQTEATDYRYAQRQGSSVELDSVELDEELMERCVRLAHGLNLPFAGIDLKVTSQGEIYCFEVNPSPGFSYFEAATGQPISLAVARYLAA